MTEAARKRWILAAGAILRDERAYLDKGACFVRYGPTNSVAYLEPEGFACLEFLARARTFEQLRGRYAELLGVPSLGDEDGAVLAGLFEMLVAEGYVVRALEGADHSRLLDNLVLRAPGGFPLTPMTFPAKATLLLTERCDLRCRHCSVSAEAAPGGAPGDVELSTAEVIALLDQLDAGGLLELKLGGGEPLLRRDFPELLTHAAEKRFDLTLLTNGQRVPRQIEALERVAREKGEGLIVSLSLDGASGESHDWLRGCQGAHARALAALELMTGRGITVHVESVLLPRNTAEMEQLVLACLTRGAASVTFHPVGLSGRARGAGLLLELEQLDEEVIPEVRRLRERYAGRIDVVFDPHNSPVDRERHRWVYEPPPTRQRPAEVISLPLNACAAGMCMVVITADGSVVPCDRALALRLGNVRRRTLAQIWGDERWRPFRGGWTLDELTLCGRCRQSARCGGKRCRAYALAELDDFYAPLPECLHSREALGFSVEDVAPYRAALEGAPRGEPPAGSR